MYVVVLSNRLTHMDKEMLRAGTYQSFVIFRWLDSRVRNLASSKVVIPSTR